MNIYLDIDGTLIHEDLPHAGKPAAGLAEFIVALRPYDVYWLTTHCMHGDPRHARALVKSVLPEELHADIDRIKPTTWEIEKTDAIDFSKEFIWLDDTIFDAERNVLEQKAVKDRQWLIEVHLDENPDRLIDIIHDYLV
jgi:hypothetical protein